MKYENKISTVQAIKRMKKHAMTKSVEQIKDDIVGLEEARQDIELELMALTDALFSKRHPIITKKNER